MRPQNLRYILLNTPATEGITIGSYHAKPNRLDVYVDDTYVVPENGEYDITIPFPIWIFHAKPNTLDVYVDDTYVVPENGECQIILSLLVWLSICFPIRGYHVKPNRLDVYIDDTYQRTVSITLPLLVR